MKEIILPARHNTAGGSVDASQGVEFDPQLGLLSMQSFTASSCGCFFSGLFSPLSVLSTLLVFLVRVVLKVLV